MRVYTIEFHEYGTIYQDDDGKNVHRKFSRQAYDRTVTGHDVESAINKLRTARVSIDMDYDDEGPFKIEGITVDKVHLVCNIDYL